MNRMVLPLVLALSLHANINTLEESGKTYPIKEKNIIELFKNHVEENRDEIEKKLLSEQKKIKHKIKNYKPKDLTIELVPATKEKVFFVDPSYVVKDNIYDADGKILYKKGFTFNPLHYVSLNERYVVIDFNRKEEREWVKNKGFDKDITLRILISNGSVFDAVKFFKREVFFVNNSIIEKFKLSVTPSMVEQDGDRIKIYEYIAKEEKNVK